MQEAGGPVQAFSLWVEFEADAPDGAPRVRGMWTEVVPWVPQAACLAEKQARLAAADRVQATEVSYKREGDRFTTIDLGPSPNRGMRRQWTLWCLPADVDPLRHASSGH
jgi:hypothetical protein